MKILNKIKNHIYFEKNKLINYFKIRNLNNHDINLFESDEWNQSFKELIENGISKLPIKLHFKENFNNPVNFKKFHNLLQFRSDIKEVNDYGKSVTEIDINSKIFEGIFIRELKLLIKNYYRSNFWLRNCPTLGIDIKNFRKKKYSQSHYHTDHCERQLSLVILLNDITDKHTHTRYILKSHKLDWLLVNENRFNQKQINLAKKLELKYSFKNIIGSSGDVYLFDAGNGLHKAVYGDDRYIIHFNFACMRKHSNYNENFEKNEKLKGNTYYDVPLNEDFIFFLKKNGWTFENFKYTSNYF